MSRTTNPPPTPTPSHHELPLLPREGRRIDGEGHAHRGLLHFNRGERHGGRGVDDRVADRHVTQAADGADVAGGYDVHGGLLGEWGGWEWGVMTVCYIVVLP